MKAAAAILLILQYPQEPAKPAPAKVELPKDAWSAAVESARKSGRFAAAIFALENDVYCDALRDKTLADPAVAELFQRLAVGFVANPQRGEGRDLRDKYTITVLPSVVFSDPATGGEVDRISGFLNAPEFLDELKIIQKGDTFAALEKKHAAGAATISELYLYSIKLKSRMLLPRAKAAWREILKRDPDDKEGKTSLAEFNLILLECQESQDYTKLRELAAKYDGKPGALEAHVAMARFLVQRIADGGVPGDLDQAVASYEYMLSHGLRTGRVLNQYAWLLATHNKNLDRALEVALDAWKLDPASGDVADTVAECYLLLKNYELALEWEKKAVAGTRDPEARKMYEIKARHFEDLLRAKPASKPASTPSK